MIKSKIYQLFLIALFLTPLSALEFYLHGNNSKSLNAVMAIGEIKYNDVEKLDHFLSKLPHKKHTAIYLDSPGGNLMGGMRLGRYFKQHKIKTVIQSYKICASACALSFLGGTDYKGNKWMSSTTTSQLGFHAFSNSDGTQYADSDLTQQVVAEILKYTQFVNAPMEIIIKNFSTPSNSMYWFNTKEVLSLGIKVWDVQNNNFVTSDYQQPNTYNYSPTTRPTYSKYQQSSTDFIKEYFNSLKHVPYVQTWNMLSSSMKKKVNLTQYTKWWDGQVKKIEFIGAREVRENKIHVKLKYYMKNAKTICSQDTITLQRNSNSWLIDNQKSKTISCS